MKLGMVIPVSISNEQRLRWAEASLRSLGNTSLEHRNEPIVLFVADRNMNNLTPFSAPFFPTAYTVAQPADAKSIDSCNIFGWHKILDDYPEVTHLAMGTVDWIYHPTWYRELEALVSRHPSASAWWVYRSAFEFYHKTLRIDGDVLVRSINAGGCFPASDFRMWNPDYHEFRIDNPRVTAAGYDERTGILWYEMGGRKEILHRGARGHDSMKPLNHGLTLDLYDPWLRQGERWVTKRSYILNIGMVGENQRIDAPEYAVDWVGL